MRIAHLPFTMAHKARFALICAHTRGLYGCEASPVDESALKHYTSILLRVVGTKCQMHARSLTFEFSGGSYNVDPYVEFFTRRMMMLRRVWIKLPGIRTQITQLYQHYEKHHAPGTHWDQTEVDILEPAPLPGGARRGDWRWTHPPLGPVGVTLENVHWMAATLSLPTFTLRSRYDHTIHIMSDPFTIYDLLCILLQPESSTRW